MDASLHTYLVCSSLFGSSCEKSQVVKHQNKLQLGFFTVVSEIENDHVMKSFLNMERYILVFCVVYLVCIIESSGANFILDCQNQFKVVKYEGKYKMIIYCCVT